MDPEQRLEAAVALFGGGVEVSHLLALPPFCRSFVVVEGAELRDVTEEQAEAVRRLAFLLSSQAVRVEAVPNTVAERLAELLLVSGLASGLAGDSESPALADLVAVASLLSSHEDHLEAWESMDLRRRLVNIANDPATDQTTRLAGEMVPKLSALKGRDRVKTFRFGDGDGGVSGTDRGSQISIDVRQLRYTQVGLAWKVWDSGLLLSSFIYRHRDVFRGKSVLELGSGCGLAGLVMAHFASKVFITDYIDEVLDNIRHNLAVYNGQNEGRLASDAVTVHRLDWTDPATYPQMGEGKADVVIGSDVVYDLTAATSVPRVIRSFLHPERGVAIILLPAMRMGVARFEEAMEEEGMSGRKWVIPNRGNDDALHFFIYTTR